MQSWFGQSLILFSYLPHIYLEKDVDYLFYVLIDRKTQLSVQSFLVTPYNVETSFTNFINVRLLTIVEILRNNREKAWDYDLYTKNILRLDVNALGIYSRRRFILIELISWFFEIFTMWLCCSWEVLYSFWVFTENFDLNQFWSCIKLN